MENQDYVPEDDEINLLDYWRVIKKRKKMITRIVIITVFATALISLFMTNIYQAKAMLTPVMTKETSGGAMAALAQQLGGLATLGISMPSAASASEIVNLLKSNVLREKIITQYNLLPVLFYKEWDEKNKKWKREGGGGFSLNPIVWASKLARSLMPADGAAKSKKTEGIPDVWDGLRLLNDIVRVNQNMKENTITIAVDFPDPDAATKIVEYFLSTLNDHMSSETKRVAMTNRKYLESQLGETSDPLIKQKIYNLIAQQIETSMMAEVKENFAFKVLDPPKTPDKKIKPKRATIVILSFIMALFAGILAAFFLEYLEKAKAKPAEQEIP